MVCVYLSECVHLLQRKTSSFYTVWLGLAWYVVIFITRVVKCVCFILFCFVWLRFRCRHIFFALFFLRIRCLYLLTSTSYNIHSFSWSLSVCTHTLTHTRTPHKHQFARKKRINFVHKEIERGRIRMFIFLIRYDKNQVNIQSKSFEIENFHSISFSYRILIHNFL